MSIASAPEQILTFELFLLTSGRRTWTLWFADTFRATWSASFGWGKFENPRNFENCWSHFARKRNSTFLPLWLENKKAGDSESIKTVVRRYERSPRKRSKMFSGHWNPSQDGRKWFPRSSRKSSLLVSFTVYFSMLQILLNLLNITANV